MAQNPGIPSLKDYGISRFFQNQTFHFQNLRVLNDIAARGGDLNEVLMAISTIPDGDTDTWFDAFSKHMVPT
ncbi:hypothetical protein A4S02_06070 [Acetobacter ascendens]|uniref:Uncharacterized protein n=1 Tax=Acetobacter ascendens TaxID=481146 RepID=A0A1D8QVS8_9PROT|nr:hypothetical protein [Acetobacter ascendens]AOW46404.1 hypothetical protein A4S02_06070 [Acetobacter ascendens]